MHGNQAHRRRCIQHSVMLCPLNNLVWINWCGSEECARSHDLYFVVRSGRVLKFWGRLLERCREREVWLEDWTGVNITQRDLLRAGQVLASLTKRSLSHFSYFSPDNYLDTTPFSLSLSLSY